MKKTLLALGTLMVFVFPAFGLSLRGTVTDATNRSNLESVSLFIENTTYGTNTLSNGSYRLECPNVPEARLVVACIGYESKVFAVDKIPSDKEFNITLKAKAYDLEAVAVVAKDLNRAQSLRVFEHALFEDSKLGKKCTILNPEVIHFKRSTDADGNLTNLSATASEPIRIENKLLAYEIKLNLSEFEVNNQAVRYTYMPFFIDQIASKSVSAQKNIRTERLRAYLGSRMHFFRSLYENKLPQNGFKVYRTYILPDTSGIDYSNTLAGHPLFTQKKHYHIAQTEIPLDLNAFTTRFEKHAVLALNEPFEVHYLLAGEESHYLKSEYYFSDFSHPRGQQTTLVRMLTPPLVCFPEGNIKDPDQLICMGYWGYRKVGDLLPLDYKP
jgi:hypothetical protein